MTDEERIKEFVHRHPRLAFATLNKGASFYLSHHTWECVILALADEEGIG